MSPQLANLLRLVFAMLGARLATKGWLEPGAEGYFADYAINALGAVTALASIFSAFRSVRRQVELVNSALALPAYSTPFSMKEAVSGGGWRDHLIQQAINTALAAAGDELRRTKFRPLFIRLRDALNTAFPLQG